MKSSELITQDEVLSLDKIVGQLSTNLQSHINSAIDICHLNVTVDDTPVYDNSSTPYDDSPGSPLGNKVGDVTLVIKAGGYIYRIPASRRPTGPIKVPQIASSGNPPASGRLFYSAGGGVQSPAVDGSPGYYPVNATVTSSKPLKVGWQVYLNSGGWTDIKKDTYYQFGVILPSQPSVYVTRFRVDGVDRFTGLGAGEDVSYQISSTSLSPVSVTTEIGLWVDSPGGNCDYTRVISIRASFSNVDSGGGVKYSTPFSLDFSDRAPCCWFFTEANIVSRLEPTQWVIAGQIEKALYRKCRRALAWYVFNGENLVKAMKSSGVSPDYFKDFSQRMLKQWEIDQESTVNDYISEVIKMTEKYWPEKAKSRRFQAIAGLTGQCQ